MVARVLTLLFPTETLEIVVLIVVVVNIVVFVEGGCQYFQDTLCSLTTVFVIEFKSSVRKVK
jgi:hypothetical protein